MIINLGAEQKSGCPYVDDTYGGNDDDLCVHKSNGNGHDDGKKVKTKWTPGRLKPQSLQAKSRLPLERPPMLLLP